MVVPFGERTHDVISFDPRWILQIERVEERVELSIEPVCAATERVCRDAIGGVSSIVQFFNERDSFVLILWRLNTVFVWGNAGEYRGVRWVLPPARGNGVLKQEVILCEACDTGSMVKEIV